MKNRSSSQEEEIRERWDSMYRTSTPEELPWDENKPNEELVSLIESGQIEKGAVLDICSGTGNNAIFLAKKGYACYGIDISPAAVKYAHQKAQKQGVSCDFSQGNASRLDYPEDHFTLVFDRGCFHSISAKNRASFIKGIHRILKSRGKYLLLCFSTKDHPDNGLPHSFSPGDIERIFSKLFKIEQIKESVHEAKGTRRIFLVVLLEKLP